MTPPSTDEQITNIYMQVRRRQPAFPGFKYGFLYGTRSNKCRTVAVPFNYGVDNVTDVHQLHVGVWVPNPALEGYLVDMDEGHKVVTHFPPGAPTPLEFPYSIFYVPPQTGDDPRVNECRALRTETPFQDNILVLKHGKRDAVINMDAEDGLLVDCIVNTYITDGLLE